MVYTFPQTYFCFLDILGFSRFVMRLNKNPEFHRNPLMKQKKLMDYYNVIQPLVLGSVYGNYRTFSNDEVKELMKTDDPRLNSYIVSDSILLWTDDVSYQSLILLLDVVKHIIMANFSWSKGFPIRGAISMGSLSFNQNELRSSKINFVTSLVGDALVKAADMEWNQNWAGCAVDDSIIEYLIDRYPGADVVDELQEWKLLVKYPVPLKAKPRHPLSYAVVWPSDFKSADNTIYDLPIQLTFERNGSIERTSIQEKFQNTLSYIHYLFQLYSGSKGNIES